VTIVDNAKAIEQELISILRMFVYSTHEKRSDKWIKNRSLCAALLESVVSPLIDRAEKAEAQVRNLQGRLSEKEELIKSVTRAEIAAAVERERLRNGS
jgi:hypothetical protein